MRFQATIELGGKTATGIAVPPEIVDSLGSGKRPRVQGHDPRLHVPQHDRADGRQVHAADQRRGS